MDADISGLNALHPLDGAGHIAFDVQLAGLPCADGEQDMGVAHLLQLVNGGSRSAALDLHIVLLHQRNILLDGLIGDTEGGDHMAGHAAEAGFTLENSGLDAGTAQEVGGSDTGGAAADDGSLLARHLGRLFDGGHQCAVALIGSHQLDVADMDGLLIEVAGALVLTAVSADGTGQERQGVLLGNQLQRGTVQALAHQLDILGNILLDGAAALAGGGEAVDPGHLLVALAGGQGLDGLDMVIIRAGSGGQRADRFGVGAGECLVGHILDLLHHLQQTVVSAGLENRGGHGDGPDACGKQLVAVEVLRAACEGDTHLALELAGNTVAHLDRQGEQGAAGHIHLVVGQFAAGSVNGEGVGELQTELQTVLVGQRLQTREHGNGVGPLQILVEVVIVEHDVVIAHGVQRLAGRLVAQNGGVALNEGVQMLLADQIGSDALDFIRGTAVQGGNGDGAGHTGIDRVDIVALLGEHLLQNGQALAPDRGLGGVHHALQIGVDLLALDAFQVVTHGHVEHEAVGIAQIVHLAQHLQSAPGLDILVHGLRNGQLSGPLLVVALVVGQDAGTGHTGGQLGAVHLLHGLDLEETGTGHVGGDNVLGQLAVGTGGGTEGGLNALTENGQALAVCLVSLVDAEDLTAHGVLGDNPVHQGLERNRIHFFRHSVYSFSMILQRIT